MANYDLGTAHGKVVIDYDDKGIKRSKTDLDEVKKKGIGAGDALDKTSRGLGIAGITLAAGIGLAVKSATDFEKQVSAIGAVTGATGAQLDQVRNKALQLGRDTQFSASQAAQAMEELAKAGIALPDIMNGAADATVALAAAGGIDLPAAATIAANAMNQFQLSAQNMPEIVDLISGAANASAIDVKDLGDAMAQVGAVAHSMGLTFGETASAIAVLGNAGIKGSDAGTSLKQMFISLANPTKQSAALMKEIGFNAFDSTGHIKSLAAIAEGLKVSMENMTPQARNAALAIIFGSDAARAGAIFFQNGAKGMLAMGSAMNKFKAADVAKARMNNLSGSVEQFKGSIETAAIKMGEMGQGPLKNLIDSVTGLINSFSNLSPTTQQTIAVLVASVAGLALFGAGLIKAVRFVQELTTVLKVLRVTAAAGSIFSVLQSGIAGMSGSLAALAANPIALIIIAIIALGIALVIAYKKSQTFRNIVNGVFGAVRDFCVAAFKVIAAVITGTIGLIADIIGGTIRVAASIWNTTWSAMAAVFRAVWAVISPIVTVAMAIIRTAISVGMIGIRAIWAIWLFLAPILQAVWNLVVAIVRLAIAAVKLAIVVQLVILKQLWNVFWTELKATVEAIWIGIKAIVSAGMAVLRAIWNVGFAVLRGIVNTVLAVIHALFRLWVVQKIVGVVRSGINGILGLFRGLVSIIGTVAGIFVKVVQAASKPVLGFIKWLGGIGKAVIGVFKNAGSWLLDAGRRIIIGLINGITSMIKKLTGLLGWLTNKIKEAKGPPPKDKVLLTPAGQDIMQSLMDGIASRVPELERLLNGIGPGNIVASVVQSRQIETSLSATLAGRAASESSATLAQLSNAPGSASAIDYRAMARAMRDAGVGDALIELDGEIVSRKLERTTGRRTNQRRRTQP
jgi:TP901 family phage tail tape measure protein